ncbi:YdgH/BhsA/McbA family protein, partial [Enterobacter asburiae]
MKTGIKVLIGALAFVVSNAYAAEYMTKLEFEKVESQYTSRIGAMSFCEPS